MLKKIITTVSLLFLFSCDKDNDTNISYESEYEKSLNSWSELKKTNGTSYSYESSFVSWAGFGSTTKITVVDNKVTSREYIAFNLYDPETDEYLGMDNKIITDQFSEDINTLNTNNQGAKTLTIDELYVSCAADYLTVSTSKNEITFTIDSNGILTNCSYYPIGCQDDCSFGISINNFKWAD